MMSRIEAIAGASYAAAAEIVKACECGLRYDVAGWATLRIRGYQIGEPGILELRDCLCGSTIARQILIELREPGSMAAPIRVHVDDREVFLARIATERRDAAAEPKARAGHLEERLRDLVGALEDELLALAQPDSDVFVTLKRLAELLIPERCIDCAGWIGVDATMERCPLCEKTSGGPDGR